MDVISSLLIRTCETSSFSCFTFICPYAPSLGFSQEYLGKLFTSTTAFINLLLSPIDFIFSNFRCCCVFAHLFRTAYLVLVICCKCFLWEELGEVGLVVLCRVLLSSFGCCYSDFLSSPEHFCIFPRLRAPYAYPFSAQSHWAKQSNWLIWFDWMIG